MRRKGETDGLGNTSGKGQSGGEWTSSWRGSVGRVEGTVLGITANMNKNVRNIGLKCSQVRIVSKRRKWAVLENVAGCEVGEKNGTKWSRIGVRRGRCIGGRKGGTRLGNTKECEL